MQARAEEIEKLQQRTVSKKAEFVAVYGRRRVGKTGAFQFYQQWGVRVVVVRASPPQPPPGFPFQVRPRTIHRTSGFPLQSLARYAILFLRYFVGGCNFEMHPIDAPFLNSPDGITTLSSTLNIQVYFL